MILASSSMKPMYIFVSILSLIFPVVLSSSVSELAILTSCTCPGHRLLFECTAIGSGATVWNGTALDQCPGGKVFMRHSEFQSGRTWMCSNGQIVGRTIDVTNQSYTSQLAVTVNPGLNGRNIQCSYDNGIMPYVIGVSTIHITTVPLPPPSNISLSSVQRGQLIFSWDPVVQNCPALYYDVIASNCGACPETTVDNFITCNVIQLMESSGFHTCTMIVETVVCGNILGPNSEPLVILVKVPNPPYTVIIPEYSGETNLLQKLLLNLTEPERISLTNGIDGSATSYTVTFCEATSGSQCDSIIISAATCKSGMCSYEFDVSLSSCPALRDITVTAFSTSVLGDGPSSNDIFISAVNNFIQVRFDIALSKILCIFSDEAINNVKHCEITYGPNECDNASLISYGEPSASQIVEIPLSLNVLRESAVSEQKESYCYKIKGMNGTNTITISGMFVTATYRRTGMEIHVAPSLGTNGFMNGQKPCTQATSIISCCDPALLAKDTQTTQLTSLCGASHTSLGIKNGFVCYSGTDTGSNAFYYCFDCGYNTIKKSADSFIRTCKSNGKWDGAIPQCTCDCSHMTSSEVGIPVIAGFMAPLLLLLGLIITFISITIFLIKIKAKLMVELKAEKDKNMLYDVVGVGLAKVPQTGIRMDTAVNVAYTSCT